MKIMNFIADQQSNVGLTRFTSEAYRLQLRKWCFCTTVLYPFRFGMYS
jgi:hypothetical protein